MAGIAVVPCVVTFVLQDNLLKFFLMWYFAPMT